jgi:peptidoglycan/LPS O-acetylase OafA/YrhL
MRLSGVTHQPARQRSTPRTPSDATWSSPDRPRSKTAAGVRAEIQALRALAVALVVVYHLWPEALPGGFVGVDVFFAISGFLITSMLLREIDRGGTIRLSAFWARRARRLLPAALVTLLFCAVVTAIFVPLYYREGFLTDVRASTAYVQNWHLSAIQTDYFAAEGAPSPVQHYWSLSAEEQFYVVWPLIIALALLATRRRALPLKRRSVALAMGTLTAASLGWSLLETAANPVAAYFVTPTRAWEFGVGGLLALAPEAHRSPAARAALSWLGIAAIALAAFIYTDETPFPGWAALLPVVGALAVIRAGSPRCVGAPSPVMELRPVQFLGDVSYSIYLWHWPLIILAPFALGGGVTTDTRIGILMLTLLMAWLSKRWIEDPLRAAPFLLARRPRWTLAGSACATGAVLAIVAGALGQVHAQISAAEQASDRVLAERPRCFGAASRDPRNPCLNPRLRLMVVPTPIEAAKRRNAPCTLRLGRPPVCAFGVPARKAERTVALIGDSHASHWRAALAAVAAQKRWRGLSMTHSGCPFSKATKVLRQPALSQCVAWNRDVLRYLQRHREVKTVFVSEVSGGKGFYPSNGRGAFGTAVAGYAAAWRALPRSVKQVFVIRDTPKALPGTASCVQEALGRHRPAGAVCALSRRSALDVDPAAVAAARTRAARVQGVDLTRFICDTRRCFPVVGGALVYKDEHHLTTVFATTLGPYLQRAVDRVMSARDPGD